MSHPDSGILTGIAALRAALVPADRWARAALRWAEEGGADLGESLQAMGLLSSADLAALRRSTARQPAVGGTTRMAATPTRALRGVPEDMMEETAAAAGSVPANPVPPGPPVVFRFPSAPAGRFRLERELGRGGVGVVVEVIDTVLGRRAALKMLPANAPAEALERFRWEARVAGRLEHPNIVTMHELGVLAETRRPYLVMKKVDGRDMKAAIAGRLRLRRLVEAFRDVCRAVAHAHERGVIHRDLKPSNVMLGDYGEVVVVDWGLARMAGEQEPARAAGVRPAGAAAHITLDGEILGTPSYMSPEQAQGKLAEIDARSDVWSLGAILYEIVTGRMPYEGATPADIVRRVVAGPPRPPGVLAPVPATLEAICLRAMSHDRAARYATAAEVAQDVDGWLEGTREKERRETSARAQVARAVEKRDRLAALDREQAEAEQAARDLRARTPGWEGSAARAPLWAAEDRVQAILRERAEAFADAETSLVSALSLSPGDPAARRLRADLWWRRWEEAEAAGDLAGAASAHRIVEAHDDGTRAALLRGEGTLGVAARIYPCACLTGGRSLDDSERDAVVATAWPGLPAAGLPPIPGWFRVHGPSCVTQPLAGAEVWAFRVETIDRIRIPVTPGPGSTPIPDRLLDAVFGDSIFRPRGPGLYLGRTPVAPRPWPGGSWLLVLAAESRVPVRVPLHIRAGASEVPEVTLFRPGEIPSGMLPMAEGSSVLQGDPGNPYSLPPIRVRVPDAFLGRVPVTCAEYLEYVNDLQWPGSPADRVPRNSDQRPLWPILADGSAVIPDARWLRENPRDLPPALPTATDPWDPSWPVYRIPVRRVFDWLRWRSWRDGRIHALPTGHLRERAARGADRRVFPWGDHADSAFSNVQGSRAGGVNPSAAGASPFDESPWGVRDLAGNAVDLTLESEAGFPQGRGAGWATTLAYGRASRVFTETSERGGIFIGFRAFSPVRLPLPAGCP